MSNEDDIKKIVKFLSERNQKFLSDYSDLLLKAGAIPADNIKTASKKIEQKRRK
jgi:hypothetical protein